MGIEGGRAEIEAGIKSVLVNDLFVEVPHERIGPDDSLRDVIGLDSLGFMELRVQCENKFSVSISEEDFAPENFTNIRSIIDLILRLRASEATAVAHIADSR
ncbi:acyl carrier protein [Streptomyces xiangluensis]|uniref:Acyl carrier protein n=1 Tax=Streptomyces xiangluensis TaxID=2665720 RepID=A0ABV8YMW3_9ACTN